MTQDERLVHMHEQQSSQLAYRRRREIEVFTWTTSILLAFIIYWVLKPF